MHTRIDSKGNEVVVDSEEGEFFEEVDKDGNRKMVFIKKGSKQYNDLVSQGKKGVSVREYYKGIESSEHPSDDDKSSTTK